MRAVALFAAITAAAALTLVFAAAGARDGRGPALAAELETPRSLLALVEGRTRLAHIDPATLRILAGRSVRLGSGTPSAVRSADGRSVAVGGAAIQIVDVKRMRLVSRFARPAGMSLEPLAWLRPDRLLASDHRIESTHLLVIDPQQRRVVSRRTLGGEVIGRGESLGGERRLVLLVAARGAIEPARLLVLDGSGEGQSIALGRIQAGITSDTERNVSPVRWPGLAVDGAGRAFVVGAGAPVAEVDLDTLAVAYHELSEPVSLLDRVRNWLDPEARADPVEGPSRAARWLGEGLIAVSGNDAKITSNQAKITPAGLKIIDTRTWSVRTIDERVTTFEVAGDLVLASSPKWDAATSTQTGIGLAAYTAGGQRRFQLLGSEPVWELQAAGRYAYVPLLLGRRPRTAVVDLASGNVARVVRRPMPLLIGPTPP